MNPLFQMMSNPGGNVMNLLQQFKQFRSTFQGNPQEQVQQLLRSGRVSQAQYDNAVKMAQQLQGLLK